MSVFALQWGHSQTAVETEQVYVTNELYAELQWGHSQTAVETNIQSRLDRPPSGGFNGATAKQLWKRSNSPKLNLTAWPSFNGATAKQLWKLRLW